MSCTTIKKRLVIALTVAAVGIQAAGGTAQAFREAPVIDSTERSEADVNDVYVYDDTTSTGDNSKNVSLPLFELDLVQPLGGLPAVTGTDGRSPAITPLPELPPAAA